MSPNQPQSPTGLPRDTWRDTLTRTVKGFKENKLNHWGAALTYYAVLSLFPALLVLVSLVGLFANPSSVTRVLTDTVSQLGPSSAAKTFSGPIDSITSHRGTAGIIFVVGIVSALWAASGYVSAFTDASNSIYEVGEGRPFWKLKPLQVAITFVLILLAAFVALALVLTGPIVGALGGSLGIGDTALTLWRYAKWPAMVLLILVIFGVLYYATPNARVSGVRWVTAGAVLALTVWILASLLFALYVSNFSSYDKTYGTLGGVVVFLIWMWITNMAILFGAQFNAETERAGQMHAEVSGAKRALRMPERQPADPPGNELKGPEMRSSRKDQRAGVIDTVIGRVAEAVGKLTGNRKTTAKGKAARARGRGRKAKGRAKRGGR